MLTDRCSTMCLLVNLALLYPRATLLFQLSMSLDVASHWLHLHRSAASRGLCHWFLGQVCRLGWGPQEVWVASGFTDTFLKDISRDNLTWTRPQTCQSRSQIISDNGQFLGKDIPRLLNVGVESSGPSQVVVWL